MAADTKADDWFIAAHVLRVRTSSGTASISFKIGSRVANIAALLGCSGPISGSGVSDTDFQLDSQLMRNFSGPLSLKDVKGHRGDVTQNVSFSPDACRAWRLIRVEASFLISIYQTRAPMTFTIRGQWMVKMVLNLGTTFVI